MPSNPPCDPDSVVRVVDLCVSYPRRPEPLLVLDGVSLALARGEICGLAGPSGAGKTTLLHVLMGLVAPDSGSVELVPVRRALVFQRPQLFPWRSVLDNAAYGLECSGVNRELARQRARAELEKMGLGDHLHDRPHQLSEGMGQRVNLARALLLSPELLLMDEPYSALDVVTRMQLQLELLEYWREREFTLLFASHSLEEVALLCDRAIVLSSKPARVRAVLPIDLPRPRASDPEARSALLERAAELARLLA